MWVGEDRGSVVWGEISPDLSLRGGDVALSQAPAEVRALELTERDTVDLLVVILPDISDVETVLVPMTSPWITQTIGIDLRASISIG